jgi:prophage regulatory protein
MINTDTTGATRQSIQILRHAEVRTKLNVSSAKLFDMVAKGLFPRPFQLIPGGRAVGWLESDVNQWIQDRKELNSSNRAGATSARGASHA